jgi:hypothetical protein
MLPFAFFFEKGLPVVNTSESVEISGHWADQFDRGRDDSSNAFDAVQPK